MNSTPLLASFAAILAIATGCSRPTVPPAPAQVTETRGPLPLTAYPALHSAWREFIDHVQTIDRNQPEALAVAKARAMELVTLLLQFQQRDAAHAILTFTARATGDPVEYLYEVSEAVPEPFRAQLWPDTPYIVIENFESPYPVHLAKLYEYQNRAQIDGGIIEAEGHNGSRAFRIQASESTDPDGRCLLGLRVASFPIPARPFGLRARVRESGAPDVFFIAGYEMRGAKYPTEVRLVSPSAAGDWKLFDSGESYYDVKRQVAQQYFFDQFFTIPPSLRNGKLSEIVLALQYVGVDLSPGGPAEIYIDDIEIYLPPHEIIDKLGVLQDDDPAIAGGKFLNAAFGTFTHEVGKAASGDSNAEEIERLNALGYVGAEMLAPEEKNVVLYDAKRTYEGLNFYISGHYPNAVLMDMTGNVLHEWKLNLASDKWPPKDIPRRGSSFRRAVLLPDGDVIAVAESSHVVRMDSRGEPRWVLVDNYHHDIEIVGADRMYVLARMARVVPEVNPKRPILEDFVAEIGMDGVERRRVSILRALLASPFATLLDRSQLAADVFHTNDLEVLDGRLESRDPAFQAGRILLSLPQISTIAVLDFDTEKIVWAKKGEWGFLHNPTILDNGNVLLFDNFSLTRKGLFRASRVLEIDVFTGNIYWQYAGNRNRQFFSQTCGTNQKLPNGNVLISETDNGVAFEVTPDGETVWRFVNPNRGGDNNELIAKIMEMRRLPSDFPLDWLKTNGS